MEDHYESNEWERGGVKAVMYRRRSHKTHGKPRFFRDLVEGFALDAALDTALGLAVRIAVGSDVAAALAAALAAAARRSWVHCACAATWCARSSRERS